MSLGVQGLLYTRLAKRRQIQKNDSMAEGWVCLAFAPERYDTLWVVEKLLESGLCPFDAP
jgi:hypothetical protein